MKNDIKDDKKIQQGNSRNQHLKPSTSTKRICLHNMSRQPDSHFRMANHLSHIGYLIKGPTINRSGLEDLLWHIQWEPPQNLHPTTKEICEQIIHYITDGATNNEQSTYNKNMELLSVTLEGITKIIMSESRQMRIDLLHLYLNKEKEAQQPQQRTNSTQIRTRRPPLAHTMGTTTKPTPNHKRDMRTNHSLHH